MNKNAIRGMSGMAVLLVLYFLAAFLIPFVHAAVFWMSFVFTLIAFGVTAFSLYTAFFKKPDARSRFYGFPIAKIGVIYGGVQLVLGLLMMALGKWVPVWVAVLLYAVLLGCGGHWPGQRRRSGGGNSRSGQEAEKECGLYACPPIPGQPNGLPVQPAGGEAVQRGCPLQ